MNLIDYILESGTQIVFFLPPYHPRYYQRFKKERPCIVAKIEAMLRSFARSRNIPVLGSYDPGSLNLSSKDFIDHAHARDYVVEKIFKEYQEVTRKQKSPHPGNGFFFFETHPLFTFHKKICLNAKKPL